MENKKNVLMTTLCFALLCLAFTMKRTESKISIADAVAKGIVKIKLSGKGGHSGNCISLDITNLKQSDYIISFDAGRRLNSNDDGEQDLLMARNREIPLKAGEKKKMDLAGFCCQLSNSSPKNGSGFGLGEPADEKLLKLSQFINGKIIPDDIVQEAVWSVSDGQDPSNISTLDDDSKANETVKKNVTELRKFICDLLGKEDPWYSTPQKRVVTAERTIVPNPMEVYGAINYEIKKTTVINSELQDENHKVLFSFAGKNTMTPGKWDYNFSLKVAGFPKGKYHVILKASGEQIMDKEFAI
jgi:hypothetical protein